MEILSKCRRADIAFHRTGRIDVSSFAASRLGLHEGDAINVAVLRGKHYVYVSCRAGQMQGRFRNVCRRGQGNAYRAYGVALAGAMIPEGEDKGAYASAGAIFVKEFGRMLQINLMKDRTEKQS